MFTCDVGDALLEQRAVQAGEVAAAVEDVPRPPDDRHHVPAQEFGPLVPGPLAPLPALFGHLAQPHRDLRRPQRLDGDRIEFGSRTVMAQLRR